MEVICSGITRVVCNEAAQKAVDYHKFFGSMSLSQPYNMAVLSEHNNGVLNRSPMRSIFPSKCRSKNTGDPF